MVVALRPRIGMVPMDPSLLVNAARMPWRCRLRWIILLPTIMPHYMLAMN